VFSRYTHILALLLKLRQCCDHPYLVLSHTIDTKLSSVEKIETYLKQERNSDTKQKSLIPTSFIDEAIQTLKEKKIMVTIFF
jgi:DNA repair protein RAD5